MPFPPEEIESRRFVPAFRGYDREEVETFLRAVAADYRKLVQRAGGDRSHDEVVIEIRLPRSRASAPVPGGAEGARAELQRGVARLQELVVRLTDAARSSSNGAR